MEKKRNRNDLDLDQKREIINYIALNPSKRPKSLNFSEINITLPSEEQQSAI